MFFPETATLIQWKEPSQFERSKTGYYILVSTVIISVLILIVAVVTQNSPNSHVLKTLGISLGLLGTALILSGLYARDVVVLKEDRIARSAGRIGFSSDYKDIESCIVSRKEFPSATFFYLAFTVKKQKRFSILPPMPFAILPNDLDLSSVLDILRSKEIKIVENYAK